MNAFLGRGLPALVLAAGFAAGPAAAHPHIFIEDRVEVIFDAGTVSGLRLNWTFDEIYSASLREDYTKTPQGPITPADIKSLHDGAFVHLIKVNYFTAASLNGKALRFGEPREFTAHFANDKAVYSFILPLIGPKPPADKESKFVTSTFDPEFYVDYELASEAGLTVTGGEPYGAKCTAGTEMRNTPIVGQAEADVITCLFHG